MVAKEREVMEMLVVEEVMMAWEVMAGGGAWPEVVGGTVMVVEAGLRKRE